jgi:hypothetical protein
MRRRVLWILAVAAACAAFAALPSLPAPGAAGGGEKIFVKLRALGTSGISSEGSFGATTSRGWASQTLAIGERGSIYVSIGGFDDSGRAKPDDLCAVNTGGTEVGNEEVKTRLLTQQPHLWWAEVSALPAEMGRIALQVKWDHYFSERAGSPIRVGGDTRRILMDEGERHVLDFLSSERETAHCFRNQIIEVTAELQEDPALAGETLGYDLWFKHTDGKGAVTTRRFQAAGRQGEKLEFRFVPFRRPVSGAVLEDGSAVESILETSGTIRGRLRPDGTISLDLDVSRNVEVAPAGSAGAGTAGGGGRKVFSVAPGQTVSMVLPPPEGRMGVNRTKTGMTTGSIVMGPGIVPPKPGEERMVWVDNREFYAGHKDELVLTVRRER